MKHFWYLARWHRPVGTLLLMLPCWWGVAWFGRSEHFFRLLFWFALGSAVMRGAGCSLNDWCDRDVDRQVRRTNGRPLAQNHLSSQQVLIFLLLQLMAGLFVLYQLPLRSWIYAFIGAGLMVIYPFMKRFINCPQVILGFTFNIGVWVGAAAITPDYLQDFIPLALLYGGGICWTVGYDTIYALQDRDDDIKIGVKSTAITFGRMVKPIVAGFYVASFGLILLAGLKGHQSMAFALILTLGFTYVLLKLMRLDTHSSRQCDSFFHANILLGFLIFLALALG